MKRVFLFILICVSFNALGQEGTKQFMPNSNDRLWLEFGVFDGNNFGLYGCSEKERINIYLNAGEKLYFGMKINTEYYSGDVYTNYRYRSFRLKDPNDVEVFPEQRIVTTGEAGYIDNYTEAVTGPNGAVLNGTTISTGYEPLVYTATTTGNHYIEFASWLYSFETYGSDPPNEYRVRRFALEFFDATVTDASNNIITNPGAPNKSAGRLWSKGWSFTNTAFDDYPVNAHFYVFTSDEFINKVNFKMYPFSFAFVVNSYGVTTYTEENYIKRTQSLEGDQTSDEDISEYRVFLNDPDRNVWPNTLLAPPKVQVWTEDTLYFDYDYNRNPLYLNLDYDQVYMEKNKPDCDFEDITIFKIESNIDGFTAILIDVDKDGEYSTGGSDRVIYRDMKKGLNYVLWDFKTDAGAVVAEGDYTASATFLGRGPAHFPLYDVEQMDGIVTSSIRPFNKLNTTIYWDDSQISRWGDQDGGDLMDETQQKQLVINKNVPRTWSWHDFLADTSHNGNRNTLNTWFNAIDLGYSDIGFRVTQSETKCVDGLAPWVGDIYMEGSKNADIQFDTTDFTYKFFDPREYHMDSIQILSLPDNGTLELSSVPVAINQKIFFDDLVNLIFTPTTNWFGQTSFIWTAKNGERWANNSENVYLTINTAPVISEIADQNLCTNTPTGDIAFTIFDNGETNLNDIDITGFSADPSFVPNSGIVIGGSGADRTVTVTPVANKSGQAIIYIMADDGLSKSFEEFTVYVGPDLEFSGDTTVCVGQDLYLIAQETGADSYAWVFDGSTKSSTQSLQQTAGSVDVGEWSLTIEKDGCTSTRNFTVTVSPLTTFTGDFDVCVGEELSLSATEVNASYEWSKGGTPVATTKIFSIPSASLTDAGADYTLYVSKDGCENTSDPFEITVVNQPNTGLTATGNVVDPGFDGTVTVANSQVGVNYIIYDDGLNNVASDFGTGNDLGITISSADLNIGDNIFSIGADNGNCEVELTDTAKITVRTPGIIVSSISGNTNEDGTQATFTVHLNTQPSADVTINLSSSDETEGTIAPSSITFTSLNYADDQTITVTGVDDDLVDGNVTFTINTAPATSADSNYNGLDANDVSVTNEDDDVAGVIVNPTSGLVTTEAGGTDSFTIRLTAEPTAEVTINLSSSNVNEGTVSPASVTFDSSNWDTEQTVTVTGVDDLIDDDDQTYYINTSLTSSLGDSNFNGLLVDNVEISNSDDDNAGITVNPTSGLVTTELGGTDQFAIVLNTEPTDNVTIGISSSDATEGTVSASSVTFTPANWNTSQTITVTGVNDVIDDGDITFSIFTNASTSSDPKYNGINPPNVSVTNTDDDVAGITVNPTSGLVTTEAGGQATFTIRLNTQPTANVTINLSSDNTNEGTVSPSSVTFNSTNWNTNQTLTITGVDDDLNDGNISYTIVTAAATSADGNYNTMNASDVSVTNNDNDVAGVSVIPTSIGTTEGGGTGVFSITLDSEPTNDVTISFSGIDATEGSIDKSSVTFTSANWNVAQDITVTGLNDAVADGNIVYTIITTASSTDGLYNNITVSDVTVTNADNDVAGISVSPTAGLVTTEAGGQATFTIALNTQPTGDVTITLSSLNEDEGTVSPTSITFTNANWAAKTITITGVDDHVDDGNIPYTIQTSNSSSTDGNYNNINVDDVSVTNNDNDVAGITVSSISGDTEESGTQATFTIVLDSEPTADVTIGISSDNTDEGTVSPSSVTFNSGNWNSARTITVTGVDDNIDDGDITFSIVNAVATSGDGNYDGINADDVSVTNIDDDTFGITVNPTSGLETSEAGGTATFTIVLNSEPTASVTIPLSSSNSSEGTVSTSNVTFDSGNWNSAQTITITGVDDYFDDGNISYNIITGASSSADGNYTGLDAANVSVTNIDNDVAGITVNPTSGLSTDESGTTATFTIRLDSRPTANVTIGISSGDATEGSVSPASLTFNTSNWSTEQTVTITGLDDAVDDGDITYSVITAAATSTDGNYAARNASDVSVTNTDNDIAGITVNPTSGLETTEAGGTDSFTIVLDSEPTANVVINLSSSNTDEGTVSPASVTFTSGNWNSAQTITVTGVNNNVDDDDVTYSIITSDATSGDTNYDGFVVDNVDVTNLDNDIAGFTINPVAGLYTSENLTQVSFTVRLNSEPTADVVLDLNSSDLTEGNISTSSLTFTAANWNTNQKVTITGVNDDVDDGDIAYTIVTQAAVSADVKYNTLNPSNVSVTNQDNDVAGITVNPTSLSIDEDGTSQSFTVVLNTEPIDDVTIGISSDNTNKGTVSAASITFTPADWDSPQTIDVTPVDNSIDDGDILFNIVTAAATSNDDNYKNRNASDVEVTSVNDDVAGINVTAISGNTSEDGTTATFSISLNSEPTQDVTINISSTNTDEGTVSHASVTFDNTNWSTPVEITVTGKDDMLADGNITYYITLDAATSLDFNYDGLDPDDIEVVNLDNDSPGVSVFPISGLITTEAGGTATFTIELTSQPTSDVTIGFTSSDLTEGTVSPSSVTFTDLTWNSAETITVTGVDDTDNDGNIAYTIVTGDASSSDPGYDGRVVQDVSVTNNDDTTPRLTDDATTTDEDTQKNIDVLANDLGLDDGNLIVTISAQPSHGTVNVEADNTITYTPDGLFNGDDTFNYKVCDGEGDCDEATVTVTVTFVNDLPVAVDDARGTSINTDVNVDVLFNDYGLEDGGISVSGVGIPSSGSIVVEADNTITYTPAVDFTGIATFQYQVEDFEGDNSTATVTITISTVNHEPDAVDDNVVTEINVPIEINVLSNDLNLDDGFGDLSIHQNPANGNIVVNANRTITYTPDVDYVGADSFEYLLEDADGDYDIATVTITVTSAVDHTPVANADSRATNYQTEVIVDVLTNDTGLEDGVASVVISSEPVNGTCLVNPDFTVTYTPDDGYSGTDNFGYQVCDADGDCATAIVTITVLEDGETNHVPVAYNDTAETLVNTNVTINVLANDTGLDDGFGNLGIQLSALHGTVVVNANRTITYSPDTWYIGEDSFKYVVSDIHGDQSIASVYITVSEAGNYLPVANDDARGTEYETDVTIDVLTNDTGLEDGVAGVVITTDPANGTYLVNPDFTVTYTPNNGYSGTDNFEYQVCDNDGDCSTATVTITVLEDGVTNHLPVAVDDAETTLINTSVNINVLSNDTGLDDGFGDLIIYSSPSYGSVVVNANRTITYTPSNMYIGTDQFEYWVEDIHGDYDIATVTITVEETPNYVPVAYDDSRGTEYETPVNINVLVNDEGLEDGGIIVSIETAPLQGTAIVDGSNNTIDYTPANGFSGIITFEYRVTDADGDFDVALVTITVKEDGVTNHIPDAVDDYVDTYENIAIDILVLDNDTILDGFGDLSLYVDALYGTVTLNANRTFTYTPSPWFVGTDEFQYWLEDVDGDYDHDIATVYINVLEVPNHTPVANNDSRATEYETAVTVDVLSNDTGLEDGGIVVTIPAAQDLQGGIAIVNGSNEVVYTPSASYSGTVTFNYTVTDADGDSDNATIIIEVLEDGVTNHLPVANDDAESTIINTPVDVNVLANDTGLEDGFGDLIIHSSPAYGSVVVNANRTVTYTPSNMFVGTDQFEYWIEDIHGDYDIALVTITVSDTPDYQPVANDDSRATEFNTAITLDVLSNDTGLEDAPVTVTILTDPLPAEGTVSVNADNTILFTPAGGYSGTCSFEYTVTDSDGDSDNASVTVTVLEDGEINHIPVANDDAESTIINTSVDINVLANDTGLEDGFGSFSISSAPSFGSVSVNANRSITYIPSNMFVGTDQFEYRVQDIHGDNDVAIVTITVEDTPDYQPVANDDSRATEYETAVTIDVLSNDTGLEDVPVTVSILTNPLISEGTVSLIGNEIMFTPANGYSGAASFEYTVTDNDGDSDNARVTVTVLENGETNHIPVANNDTTETIVNTAVDINVLANDTGLDDGFGEITINSSAVNGTLSINTNRTITYTPDDWFIGEDSFKYVVSDIHGDNDIATVYIRVTETPDYKPIAYDDARGTEYETEVTVDVLTNDTGLEDGGLVVVIESDPAQGTAVANADNTITYTPANAYVGTIGFQYRVTDKDADFSVANVVITVKPDGELNTTPNAIDDDAETLENIAVDINVLANDLGLDDGFGQLIIFTEPANGTVVVNPNRTITYTPAPWFIGTDEFKYWLEDVDGDYDTATVSIQVIKEGNHLPVANDDSRGTEYQTEVVVDVLANDSGLEDGGIVLSIETAPATGNATINAGNTITFTPANGYSGIETFQYRVTDKEGDFDVANVQITVLEEGEVNYTPVALNDTVETIENTAVTVNILANDTLKDGFGEILIYTDPVNGTVNINANRTITYTPANAYIGKDSLTYWIEDQEGDYDMAMVFVTVSSTPDYQPIANDDSRATEYETELIIDVLSNDTGLEDAPVAVTILTDPLITEGTVSVNANTIVFTPANGYSGTCSFEYTVTDNDGDSDNARVTVIVLEDGVINHVPIANNDAESTILNTSVDMNVLANDTGLDDGFGDLKIKTQPNFGSVVVNANRTITYTPYNMFVGIDSLVYWVEDIHGDFDTAKVVITVSETPDYQPVANDDSRATEYETPVTVNVLANDSGLEDMPVSVTILSNPLGTEGAVSLNPDNTIQFTPANGYSGVSSFEYTVTDADGDSDNARVTIIILEDGVANYIPVANDDNVNTIVNTFVDISVLANDSGLEDGFGNLVIYSQPAYGNVIVNDNRTITYTPDNLFIGTDVFEYWLEDLHGDYDIATVTVTVSDKPDYVPVANDDRRGTSFNTAVTVDVLVNDTGLEDGGIEVTLDSNPNASEGSVVVNANNTITFTPVNDYVGESVFSYIVTDIDGDSDTADVTIQVKEGTNYVPDAVIDYVTTAINQEVTHNILANDNNLNDGIGKVIIFENPLYGSVIVNSNYTITYTPSDWFVGNDQLKYWIEDVDGDYDTASVYITVSDYTNNAPVAVDDARGTSLNTAVNVDVLFNDTGLEDGGIMVTIETNPDHGTVVGNEDNTVTYTPSNNYIGEDKFDYRVTDVDGDYDIATVTITVREENTVPVAVDDKFYIGVNDTQTLNILANDYGLDDGGISVQILTEVIVGDIVINDDNSITYTPLTGYEGVEYFAYQLTDVDGDYDIAMVTIEISSGTLPAVHIQNLSGNTGEDGTNATFTVVLNNQPTNDVHIDFNSNDITEGTVSETRVTFTSDNWDVAQTVTVSGVDDWVDDGDIEYQILFKNAISNDLSYNGLNIENLTLVNEDDDEANITVINNLNETSENASTAEIKVVLDSKPLADVSFEIESNDLSEGDVDKIQVLFTEDNWADTTIITVTGIDDDEVDGDMVYTISFTASSSTDPLYNGIEIDEIQFTNLDNDSKTLRYPEAFSPGKKDGLNDYFVVENLQHHNKAKLRVYNRWGSLVYSSDSYNNDWDGKSNTGSSVGSELPTGTYFYILEIEGNSEKINGYVFIKR